MIGLKSFVHRVFGRSNNCDRTHVMPDDLIGIATTEQYVDDQGIVQNRIVYKTDYKPDPSLRVADFALQNLFAAGVQLKQMQSLSMSQLAEADYVTDVVESSKTCEK